MQALCCLVATIACYTTDRVVSGIIDTYYVHLIWFEIFAGRIS